MNLLAILFVLVSLGIVVKFLIKARKERIEFRDRQEVLRAYVNFLRETDSEFIRVKEEVIGNKLDRCEIYVAEGYLFWYLVFKIISVKEKVNTNTMKRFIKRTNETGKKYFGREPGWSEDHRFAWFIGHQEIAL